MAPRSINACALSPARDCPEQCGGQRLDLRLRFRQRVFHREQPRHHALDVTVHRHCLPVEGNRRDRRRGIRADARQCPQAIFGIREYAAVVTQHGNRTGVQIARPGIVTEPRPHPQHIIERGGSKRRDTRPSCGEFLEIRTNRFHGGLLQHDLRQPHAIWIGALTGQRTPRQLTAMPVIPGEQQRSALASIPRFFWGRFVSPGRRAC